MRKPLAIQMLLAPILLLSGCKFDVLAPAGDVAAQQRDLLLISTGLMLLIIVPVMGLTLFFAWKYREGNDKARYAPEWGHSTKLELVIWSAPLLIVICLGALTWVGTHLLDPYRPLSRPAGSTAVQEPPLRVEVVALDWKWLFIYPDQGVAAVNDLAVPVNRQVEFTLTSANVMNAFYIPAMAGMIYAMPAMETKLHGVFNVKGDFQGLSSHYSGAGFSGMRFKAHAVDGPDFDAWIARAKASGQTLDRARYLTLAAPSQNEKPAFFASVEPDLYDRVVNLCVAEGKMCMSEMAALDAKGGTGLAGAYNIAALTYDRGPGVAAWQGAPFMVAQICSPAEAARKFARAPLPSTAADMSPLMGHGLAKPTGWLSLPPKLSIAQTRPAAPSDL
ncbi:ubiquinol oxidase subunit II [bacterium]|nr:ubiquinol oxidase subunit II [bacterium]